MSPATFPSSKWKIHPNQMMRLNTRFSATAHQHQHERFTEAKVSELMRVLVKDWWPPSRVINRLPACKLTVTSVRWPCSRRHRASRTNGFSYCSFGQKLNPKSCPRNRSPRFVAVFFSAMSRGVVIDWVMSERPNLIRSSAGLGFSTVGARWCNPAFAWPIHLHFHFISSGFFFFCWSLLTLVLLSSPCFSSAKLLGSFFCIFSSFCRETLFLLKKKVGAWWLANEPVTVLSLSVRWTCT